MRLILHRDECGPWPRAGPHCHAREGRCEARRKPRSSQAAGGRETTGRWWWVGVVHGFLTLKHHLVGGFNYLEKYQSMGRIIPYMMENKKCLKPPTSHWNILKAYMPYGNCIMIGNEKPRNPFQLGSSNGWGAGCEQGLPPRKRVGLCLRGIPMGYGMPIPYIISVGTNDDELLDFAISINFGDHLVGCIMLHLILLGKSPLLVSGTSPLKTKSRRRKKRTIILWTYLWGSRWIFRKVSILHYLHLNRQLHGHQSMAQIWYLPNEPTTTHVLDNLSSIHPSSVFFGKSCW